MKKRLFNVFVLALVCIMGFVACEHESDPTSKLGTVKFVDGSISKTRALDSSVDIDISNSSTDGYYWFYTAKKISNPEFNVGEKLTEYPVKSFKKLKGLTSIGPLAAGEWEFTLTAYKYVGSPSNGNTYTQNADAGLLAPEWKAWSGKTRAIVEAKPDGAENEVIIMLKPEQTLTEDPEIEGKLYVHRAEITYSLDGKILPLDSSKEVVVTCTPITGVGVQVVETIGTGTYDSIWLKPGRYDVNVDVFDEIGAKVATGSKTVEIYDFISTKLNGVLDGIASDVGFKPSAETVYETGVDGKTVATVTETVDNTKNHVLGVNSTIDNPRSEKITTVAIPANTLASGGSAKLAVVPSGAAEEGFEIQTTEGTSIGKLDISLTVDDNEVSSFSNPIAVTTYIAPNLPIDSVKVIHYVKNESGVTPQEIAPVVYDYRTGKLTFETSSFSEFGIYLTPVVESPETTGDILNATTGKVYETLPACLAALESNRVNKLILLHDIEISYTNAVANDVEFYFNGNKLITDAGISSINKRTAVFTIQKGTFKVMDTCNVEVLKTRNKNCSVFSVEGTSGNIASLEINEGSIIATEGTRTVNGLIYIEDYGTVKLNGTKLSTSNTAILGHGGHGIETNLTLDNVDVTGCMYLPGRTDVVVNGGNYTNSSFIIYQKAGSLTLNGGTFTSTQNDENIDKHLYAGGAAYSTGDAIVLEASNYGGNGEPTLKGTGATLITAPTKRAGVVVLNLTDANAGDGQGAHAVNIAEYAGNYFSNDSSYVPKTVNVSNSVVTNWNEAQILTSILTEKNCATV